MAIFDDLEAEQDRLHGTLAGLSEDQWTAGSSAAGWSVTDVVLHLAQTEEAVVASVDSGLPVRPQGSGLSVDEMADLMVRSQRAAPAEVFRRWQDARVAAVAALRSADPAVPLSWIDAPLKPATMATTRLAEHWAHTLDITRPLGLDLPDTDRLRHIAWLAHRSLAYAFAISGQEARPVYCELTAPDGVQIWRFGPAEAESRITGAAGAYCRVAAQRLAPEESGLVAEGPYGAAALGVLRTYAA
jgi:uncharacterized protein (TIGR03084 family)